MLCTAANIWYESVNIALRIAKCEVSCEMVDCITICNSACIACIWCILFSVCFPSFSKNLRKVDSSECCVRKKPMQKHRRTRPHDPSKCVKADSVHTRRRLKKSSCFERNRENQREHRTCCCREKMCARIEEHKNTHQCVNKNKKSKICSRQVEHSDSYKSDNSLNKKNSIAVLKADKSEYCVCKRF
ncbi:uncharacterized protein LOC112552989 [Pogonomyrmex barbatus]|uniref:Uncharacterized protein LOC112552989 n=1 Tax=Pogonomyrmex barbatus TaxID=144034 RepID=A0A8N1S9D8_9HYME|nr:uncharacterized protein LOC112552989 [Pogonomyrmex barbatus]